MEWIALVDFEMHVNSLTTITTYSEWVLLNALILVVNALTETAVNNILIEAEASGITSGQIALEDGTNATPTGAGITAYDNLTLAGVTVSVNGYP